MERAIKENGELVLYRRRSENPQDKPTETYVKRFNDKGNEVIIAMKKCLSPSVRLVGLRSREHFKPEQTVKTTTVYSVKVGGEVARSRKEAEEAIQRVTGFSIPRDSRVITDSYIFDEIEADHPYE